MLDMGIPKIAVINKMKLNGVDPNLLEKNKATDTKKTISFLNQISSVTLKKNNNSNKKEVIKKSTNNFIIKPEDLAKALQKIKQKSRNISKSSYI